MAAALLYLPRQGRPAIRLRLEAADMNHPENTMMPVRSIILGTSLALTGLPALAQAAPVPAGPNIWTQLLMFVPLILIFYFLLIRPQQQRQKKHTEMVNNIKRGDTVVTSGGLIGKVSKVNDNELSVELAENVRVRVVRAMVVEVRNKAEPVPAND